MGGKRGIIASNKRGFEFSFSWLFALIVGAAIIFIAIYAGGKILKTGEFQQSTETSKKLTTLLDPLGVGEGSAKSGVISLNSEIVLYNDCFTDGSFGKQRFSTSGKKAFSEEFGEKGAGISTSNKYIFTKSQMAGRELYFFSKPLEMPFKVADIVILSSENYCFVRAPTAISDEVESLGIKNIITKDTTADCIRNITNIRKEGIVCFGFTNNDCGQVVTDSSSGRDFSSGYVEKRGSTGGSYGGAGGGNIGSSGSKRNYFAGGMIYGAIIADNENYECNSKRLTMKMNNLAGLYLEKSKLLSIRGVCDTGLDDGLIRLSSFISQYYKTSADLMGADAAARTLNQNSFCELW